MANISLAQLQQQPEYLALKRARSRITWVLAVITITMYFSLILLIAFAPDSLAQPIGQGVTSIGIMLGLGVILGCFIITGIYVYYANTVLEPLKLSIIKKLGAAQ